MKLVTYKEEDGWLKRSMVKDNMSALDAHKGVPCNPPDLTVINCEHVLRNINNLLVEMDLITLADLQGIGHDKLRNIVQTVLVREIVKLYKNGHIKEAQ